MAGPDEIFARLTRDECIRVLSHKGLIASCLDTNFIRRDRRWLGVVADIWYNQGFFDPNIEVNDAWDATTSTFRGGLSDGVRHFSPWNLPIHTAEPYDFLLPVLGQQRTAKLVEDILVDTLPTDAQETAVPCHVTPVNTTSDQLYRGAEIGYPGSYDGTVTGAPSTTAVPTSGITAIADLVGRRVIFGPATSSAAVAFSSITSTGGGSPTCRINATAGAGAFDEYHVGDRVNIGMYENVGVSDVAAYNRGHQVTAIAGDTSYIDTDVAYSSDAAGGTVYNCAGICQGLVTSIDGSTLEFSTPLPTTPRVGHYVAAMGLLDGADRSVAECAARLAAMPIGGRVIRINQPCTLNYGTGAPAWYHDAGAFGRGVASFDQTYDVVAPVQAEFWASLKTELDALGSSLDGVLYDWEGTARLDNFSTGQRNQLVAEHQSGEFPVRLGFDPAEVVGLPVNATPDEGEVISDNDWKLFAAQAWLAEIGVQHIAKLARVMQAVFPEAKCSVFRAGSLAAWRLNPAQPWRVQGNPFHAGPPEPLTEDVTVQARQSALTSVMRVDIRSGRYWLHPDAGTGPAADYASIEQCVRAMQCAIASTNGGVLPVVYQFNNVLYGGGIWDAETLTEMIIHLLLSSGTTFVIGLNQNTSDDSIFESVVLEVDAAIPYGSRRPVPVDQPRGNKWQSPAVWSCMAAGGNRYWYVNCAPWATWKYEIDVTDVVLVISEPQKLRLRIRNASLFLPAGKVGTGQWIRQAP